MIERSGTLAPGASVMEVRQAYDIIMAEFPDVPDDAVSWAVEYEDDLLTLRVRIDQ